MKKYWLAYKLAWSRELAYRFNFFLGRARKIVVLLFLFYVWRSLALKTGNFAGYSEIELFTYVFLANIVCSIVFGSQTREIAQEINDGAFSKFLSLPVNHFWFNFSKQLAQRSINFLSALIEVAVFVFITRADFLIQANGAVLVVFAISIILAIFLYCILSYLVSLFAFWSRESMGPRFLFEWFLEFTSGAYFPLDILAKSLFALIAFLPFPYLVFFPLGVYLERLTGAQIVLGLSAQIFFILFFSLLTAHVWKKGVKRYSGEGI